MQANKHTHTHTHTHAHAYTLTGDVVLLFVAPSSSFTRIHTHTHIYIYIYIYIHVCVCVCISILIQGKKDKLSLALSWDRRICPPKLLIHHSSCKWEGMSLLSSRWPGMITMAQQTSFNVCDFIATATTKIDDMKSLSVNLISTPPPTRPPLRPLFFNVCTCQSVSFLLDNLNEKALCPGFSVTRRLAISKRQRPGNDFGWLRRAAASQLFK